MCKVSIVTASYNYETYIKETIESVLAQTYFDWEMIVVDDGSKDNSVEVIKNFAQKDNRIKLYQHEGGANKGLIETVKLGLQKAKGDWIVFLESDDTIEPNYLEEKFKVIENYPNVKFVFNDLNLFGERANEKFVTDYFSYLYKTFKKIKFPAKIEHLFFKLNVVPTFSCVMARKELFENLDYDAVFPQCIDWHIWSQLARDNEFFYLDKKLTNWRMHGGSYLSSMLNDAEYNKKCIKFKKQIMSNISGGKFKLCYQLPYWRYFLYLKRKDFIRLHLNTGEFMILGKWYKFPKKNCVN